MIQIFGCPSDKGPSFSYRNRARSAKRHKISVYSLRHFIKHLMSNIKRICRVLSTQPVDICLASITSNTWYVQSDPYKTYEVSSKASHMYIF